MPDFSIAHVNQHVISDGSLNAHHRLLTLTISHPGLYRADQCLNRCPNFSCAMRRSSDVGTFTRGNWSRQCHGRQASMTARLLVRSPAALRSGSMRGSRGVEQALRMMSIEVAGSERVSMAQTTSSRLETSMSSSTTIT